MKTAFKLLLALIVPVLFFASCGEDEPEMNDKNKPTTSKEVRPEVASIQSATTKDDFTVTFRVKSVNKPNVSMDYSKETGKTSTPSLNRSSSPKLIDQVEMKSGGYSWYYYRTTHAGFSGGNYIYYRISATNSAGSCDSGIKYCIIKR